MYLPRALRNEFVNPRLGLTLALRRGLGAVSDLRRRSSGTAVSTWSDDTLQFVFDLSVAPITFDFVSYLAGAELERRLRGFSGLTLIIVPGGNDGVRTEPEDYDAAVDAAARRSRVRNIILPVLSFLPSVRGYVVCGTRAQASSLVSPDPAHVYPDGWRPSMPRQPLKRIVHEHAARGVPVFPMLKATDRARHFVAEFLDREAAGRLPIVITLRNYDFSPTRNSRNEDWLAFADRVDRRRYAPIFIHDTETAMRPPPVDLGAHIVCEAATWNLEIRMALYEAAWLNMALMHGPLELAWYNEKSRYVLFISLGAAEQNSALSVRENGHVVGESLGFAKPTQKIVWKPDSLDRIEREFLAMEAAIATERAAV
jgi:hypothetical protein